MTEQHNNKIKLVYITQSFGGVEVYIRQIIEHIDFSKFSLSIIAPSKDDFMEFCKYHHVPYYPLNMVRGFSPLKDIKAYRGIKMEIKKLDPDIIHLHSAKAGFLGRLALRKNRKIKIFTPHGISYQSFVGLKRAIFFLCEVLAKRYTDKVLACSYSEAERVQYDIGILGDKIAILCNSTSIPQKLISKRQIDPHGDIHLGSIMRLTIAKNPLLYVEVAKLLSQKYKNIHFSILGSGVTDDLKPAVLEKIEEYGLSDKFEILKWGQQSKTLDYLDSLDIFILPSLFEGFPLSPLEAMSRGVPCVLSKAYGCKDLVNNGENGFSCITAQDYVNTISQLIDNHELKDTITTNAFDYVNKKHNILNFIKDLESYYISLYNKENI